MATSSRPWLLPLLCFVLGALVSSVGIYFTVIKSSDRIIAEGRVTIADLKTADAKLQDDLGRAKSLVISITADRDARQRVINTINASVGQLGAGLDNGIATIDDVIQTIQSVINILQHG